VNAEESLNEASSAPPPPPEAPSSARFSTPSHQRNSIPFDLLIAQGSLAIELVSYISLALSSTASLFVGASALLSLGTGFGPAAQAIMLELFALQPGCSASEAGTLFGAMSIAQALATQVVGPAVFGALFSATVDVLPQAIFILGSFLILCSAIMMGLVRFPQEARHDRETTSTSNVEAWGS
jgi:MFS family permease